VTNKDALERLFLYTEWANHRLVRGAATLSREDFRRDLGGGHGGVRGTLAHMLVAELLWVSRFKGLAPERLPDEADFKDVLALRERWRVVEEYRRDWWKSVPEDGVARVVEYRSLRGAAFSAPLFALIQHLANHQSYHRGQVAVFLRRLGAKVPPTDLVLWDREQARRAAAAQGRTE
jgi:uncharacterized damage-inducible protein DinB